MEKEKMLIKKLIAVVTSGIIAWGISLAAGILYTNEITGGALFLICTLFFVIFYCLLIFISKANRTSDGLLTSFTGLFAAVTATNVFALIIFFPNGEYYNYGIQAGYMCIAIHILVFLFTEIIVSVINKRNNKKQKKIKK